MEHYSSHKVVYEVLQACVASDVKHFVISPGSRNAPFILSFAKHSRIKCYSIVDERSAAFFALGMAQQLQEPVGLVCTSGTAILNYAPAVAEAYEQNIPLLVISADRPKELVGQAEGQSICQENVLKNIVEQSYQLPSGNKPHTVAYARRLCGEALALCLAKQRPVHLNVPLWEPLYKKADYSTQIHRAIHSAATTAQLTENEMLRLAAKFNKAKKVLVLVGFLPENPQLNAILECFAKEKNVVVLTESIANLKSDTFHYNIDRLLSSCSKKEDFVPDILMTLGGTLISKVVKQWLRACPPKEHWHLNNRGEFVDTFQCLTENITVSPTTFFEQLLPFTETFNGEYAENWNALSEKAATKHNAYVAQLPWSDFQVFDTLLKHIPDNSLLQNSTVVRYHQLFPYNPQRKYASNRGVSGIDGCTSTAVGAAFVTDDFTTLITGDISFGYDSNALWHKYISPKLRLIVINNGGGGIFRFLEASAKQEELEEFFETTHSNQSFEHLAKHWGIEYLVAENKEELEGVLQDFYSGNTPKLLEVKTPQYKNAEVLRNYFKYLKEK